MCEGPVQCVEVVVWYVSVVFLPHSDGGDGSSYDRVQPPEAGEGTVTEF